MKLGNFYNENKSSKPQSKQTKFTLTNGRLELELKEEQSKNQKLQEQHTNFFNEQDELNGKINVLQEHANSLATVLEQTNHTLELKEASYNEAQKKNQGIPGYQTYIKQLEINNDNLNSIISTAQENSMQQGADLERITQERDTSNYEKAQTEAELEQRRKDVYSFQAKADEFKNKFEGIQIVVDTLRGEYKEIQHSKNTLWDQAAYWEGKATEFYERAQAIEEIDVKLRQWIEDLQVDSSEAQSDSKIVKQKITKLTALVSDMSKTITDLTSDKDYLSQLNSALKKELAKPKFMSMGAIARKEGFKMPTNKESIPMQILGNATPTLLKFKVKEENDAR
tara:strand:+ start:1036 stop:2052 length:1017 start_codon:yes stop_codon:yes gene_type:complete